MDLVRAMSPLLAPAVSLMSLPGLEVVRSASISPLMEPGAAAASGAHGSGINVNELTGDHDPAQGHIPFGFDDNDVHGGKRSAHIGCPAGGNSDGIGIVDLPIALNQAGIGYINDLPGVSGSRCLK